MNSSLFERHPDDDVLAEFAAEQLPEQQLREVETHVIDCPSCAQLLADGEHVRRLLNSGDAGPMPDDVWSQIQAALAAEASAAAGTATSAPTGSFALAQDDVPVAPPGMSFEEAPTLAWKRFLDEPAPPPQQPPVPVRVRRAVGSSLRSRRDARTDHRAGWSALRQRPTVAITAAAAGVAILVGGGLGLRSVIGSRSGGSVTAAIPGGVAAATVVTDSGADYTASTLAVRATALLARVSGSGAGGRTATTSALPSASGVSAHTVADPQQLSSCLVGLGESGQTAIVVDLARYQGREAAVIVLPGHTGGHDVWVVARTCQDGSEGELAFKKLPS